MVDRKGDAQSRHGRDGANEGQRCIGQALRVRAAKATKPPLKVGDANWLNVVKALREGFTIDQIKTKYSMDDKTEVELKTQSGI